MPYNPYNKYPYSDFHELNLDWIIATMKENVAAIQAALSEVSTYAGRLTYVESKITDLIDETERLNLKIRTVESNLGDKIDDAQTDINRIKSQVEPLVRDMETITLQVRTLSSDMNDVQDRLEAVESSIQSLNTAIETLDNNVTYTNHLILVGNHIETEYHEVVTFETIKAMFLSYKDRTILTRDGDDAIYVANATDGDAVWFSLFYEEGGRIYCERVIINSDEQINEHSIELLQNDIIRFTPGPVADYILTYKGARISYTTAISIINSNPFTLMINNDTGDIYRFSKSEGVELFFTSINGYELNHLAMSPNGIIEDYNSIATTDMVLTLENETPFEPTEDYQPATKKYVDDNAGGGSTLYSTEEKIVGTWVDGTPVYQKTYILTGGDVRGQNLDTIPDFGVIVGYKGGYVNQANHACPLGYEPTGDLGVRVAVMGRTTVQLQIGGWWGGSNKIDNINITLDYTKTAAI